MPNVKEKGLTDTEIKAEIKRKRKYCVKAYNNDLTEYKQVLELLMIYCGYQFEQADHYTKEIHRKGNSIVYWESKKKCEGLIKAFADIMVKAKLVEN